MPKKEKSKKRLDKFYHIAKEQGFRSRAAFKLIQLNKKYNFLQSATILIDLCAAPGGWLQVASKYMPQNSIIIGVDLDPIKPVPNCKTFIEDITTAKCLSTIKREIKGAKVDVVLNDGAPNVGADWNRDAYVQAELVLASLKVACELLRRGGTFATKVFRSADYHSLIWVMSKFFDKVEATKPEASRAISAEIFVVGIGYKAPDYIDKKFFDPRHVFQDNEASLADYLSSKDVNSVDKVFEIRNKRRKVIADSDTQSIYKKINLEQFVECESPYAIFVDCNRIEIRPEDKENYLKHLPMTEDMMDHCKDLLVLGKREIFALVKWRTKLRTTLYKEKRAKFEKIKYEGEDKEEEEEDPEAELYKLQKKERKAQEKLVEKRILNFAKKNMSGGVAVAESDLAVELQNFDFNKHGDLMREGKIYYDRDQEEEDTMEYFKQFGGRYHEYKKKEVAPNSEQEILDNLEFLYEERQKRRVAGEAKHKQRVEEREKRKKKFRGEGSEDEDGGENFKMDTIGTQDEFLKKRVLSEGQFEVDREELKRSRWFDRGIFDVLDDGRKKVKGQKKEDFEGEAELEEDGEEAMDEEDLDGEEEFEDELDGEEGMDEEELEEGDEEEWEDAEGEEEEEMDEEEPKNHKTLDVNLHRSSAPMDEYEVFGQEPTEEDYVRDMRQKGISKKDMKRINRTEKYERLEKDPDSVPAKPREDDINEYDDRHLEELDIHRQKLLKIKDKKETRKQTTGIDDSRIEVVPAKKFEDYDPEDLAADLALAKHMLRKKEREEILEMSFNKHNNFEYDGLPNWFVEDEKKHHYMNLPVTKEDVQAMREELKSINERPAKKILEAKFRKKRKLEKQLKKFKNQADQVFEDEGLDERAKAREVRKLKSKIVTANKSRAKKKVLHGKKFNKGPPGKTAGNKYRMVDSRSKKEMRAQKRIKRQGRSGKKTGKRY